MITHPTEKESLVCHRHEERGYAECVSERFVGIEVRETGHGIAKGRAIDNAHSQTLKGDGTDVVDMVTRAAAPQRFVWAAGFSENPNLREAVDEASKPLRDALQGKAPDLVVAFASHLLAEDYEEIPSVVTEALSPRVLLGTTGAGVIGTGREAEHRPALSLAGGLLPSVNLAPFRLTAADLTELDISPRKWSEFLGAPADEDLRFLLFAHPFTIQADELVTALDQAFPRGRVVGGLSSGGGSPDTMALFMGNHSYPEGVVGVALWGDIEFDVIVAQGCRPVGPNLRVTRAFGPDIFELDGEPALSRVMGILGALPEEDRQLARHSLFVGVAMEAHEKEGERGYDGGYLIRNIVGADPGSNVLRVGHMFHEGQTIRLQLRDAETARGELTSLLERYKPSAPSPSGAAAFLFSCTGRGVNLYGQEGHDSRLLLDSVGSMPLAGFFCNGEIGPVGEVTYVHGYTSSIGILRPKAESSPR